MIDALGPDRASLTLDEVRDRADQLGPLASFCTLGADRTPHVLPVRPVWNREQLAFGSMVTSLKVRHLRHHAAAAIQYLTLGSEFPDALLLKGTAVILDDDESKRNFWESEMFPALPRLYAGHDDPRLCFIEFTPARAFLVCDGGRGAKFAWRRGA